MVDDFFGLGRCWCCCWQAIGISRQELAVVFDLRRRAELFPVFLNCAHAMRADGDDLFHLVLRERFEIGFGELLEDEIVAQAADGIAGAFLLAQDAKAGAEIVITRAKSAMISRPFGSYAAHAAKPQAILLRAVEDGELLLLNELVALERAHAECIGSALEREKELGAVLIFPASGIDCTAPQADEDGQMLNADRTLVLASTAGCALEDGLLRVVLAEERFVGCGAELIEVAAYTEDDLFRVEHLAGVGGRAVLACNGHTRRRSTPAG